MDGENALSALRDFCDREARRLGDLLLTDRYVEAVFDEESLGWWKAKRMMDGFGDRP